MVRTRSFLVVALVSIPMGCDSGSEPRTEIPEAEFLAHITENRPSEERRAFEQLIAWSRAERLEDSFTTGPKGFQFLPTLRLPRTSLRPINVNAKGWVRLSMRSVKAHPPFDDPAKREELYQRIKGLPDLELTDSGMEGLPKVPSSVLAEPSHLSALLSALTWMVGELQKAA